MFFVNVIGVFEGLIGCSYEDDIKLFWIILDYVCVVMFLIGDGVILVNIDIGYVVCCLLCCVVCVGCVIDVLVDLIVCFVEIYIEEVKLFKDLYVKKDKIVEVIKCEED